VPAPQLTRLTGRAGRLADVIDELVALLRVPFVPTVV